MRQSTTRNLESTRRRIRVAGAVVLVVLFGAVFAATRPPSRPEVLTPMTLEVEGLDCPLWCPIQVDRTLAPLPGLFDLRARATISCRSGRPSPSLASLRILRVEQLRVVSGA